MQKPDSFILGIFDREEVLISALEDIVERDIEIYEVYTPYPVHEVFKILKRKTRLPIATFIFAVGGFSLAYYYLYYSAVLNYPLRYGGKPIHAMPSFIIISFVSMISLSVLWTFITFLVRSRLYPGQRPVVVDVRSSDDAFVVAINKSDKMSDEEEEQICNVLRQKGAIEVNYKEV